MKRGNALAVVMGVLIAVAAGEVGVRALGLAGHGPTGYAPVNTASNRRAMGPRNAQGYRDLERRTAKPAGARRILALGDSFTWGASVEFDDAWPQRVERALNREGGGGFEVVNLAVPGFKTTDEASQLLREGFAYEPDVVVVAYVLNDSEDKDAAEARRTAEWVEERRILGPPRLWKRSALASFVAGRLSATRENRRRIEGYRSMYADRATGWIAAREALRTLGGACRERGVPWLLVVFPLFGNPLDDRYPFASIHGQVAEAAAAAGARVLDLLPVYRGLRADVLVVDGADDEHPNEVAHRIAARAIVRELRAVMKLGSVEAEP